MQKHSRAKILAIALICGLSIVLPVPPASAQGQQSFTLEQVLSAPFPSDLTAAKSVPRVAWVLDEKGKRNIYVAEAPDFKARRLTSYLEEDGQELSSLEFSADGNTIVYTRGAGKNRAGQSPNPTSNPAGQEQAVFQILWLGGDPQKIDTGHGAQISNRKICAYTRDGELWLASLDGKEKPVQLVARGTNSDQRWSPDGSKLAFVSVRGDHSFIGIYENPPFRVILRKATSLSQIARTPGPFGWRMPRHGRPRKFGAAARNFKIHFPTWRTTPAEACSIGPSIIASFSRANRMAGNICILFRLRAERQSYSRRALARSNNGH